MFNFVTFIERLIYSVSTCNIIKCMILCVCFIDHLFKPHNLSTKSSFSRLVLFGSLYAVHLYPCSCLYNKYTLHKLKSLTNVSNINVCDMHITNYGSFISKQLFFRVCFFLLAVPFLKITLFFILFYFKATLLPHFCNIPKN